MSGKSIADRLAGAFNEDDEDTETRLPSARETYGISLPRRRKEVTVDERAIVPQDDGTFVYKRHKLTPVGIELPDDLAQEEWIELGVVLSQLSIAIQWAVGDWAAYANVRWGIPYEQIAQEFSLEMGTLYSYASVCRSIATLTRNQSLSFSHHRQVTALKPAEQRKWLSMAEKHKWTVAELRGQIDSANNKPKRRSPDPLNVSGYTQSASKLKKFAQHLNRGGNLDNDDRDQALAEIDEQRKWLDVLEATITRDN